MQNTDIKLRLASYYGGMTVLMVLMLISVIVFVDEAPDQPPSYAQAAVIKTKSKTGKTLETIKLLLRLFGGLLKNLQFLITTWAISTALAVIRYHITLLSSILHATFDNDISLNVKAGYALMGMSFAATLGGFIVGPIIRKHKNYKAMALLGLGGSFLSCLPMIAGILSKSLIAVEVGVVLQGLFCGFANPALYELLREVTYPKPAMQVTALTEGVTTLIVFSWLTSGRALLTNTKVVYAAGFPAVVLFFSGVFIACKKMKLHRQEAEDKGERRQLLGSDSEE
uniref:Feline leukemia virus subgroup C receptor-related protein 2-like n=1 Tax=Phallusia mammillata TaxID=59560 RepID=A0A6F9DCX7_9ASCI|nr:feline leukemia virus subgroup C receptor-related protein 2-like [Phallusia mammillata]